MTLSTIKRVTVIYSVRSSLILLFLTTQSFASEDLESFCVKPPVNMAEVRDSLSFLLLPNEKVFLRQEAHCIDVLTSTDRVKLLEKFLSKRYHLIAEVSNKASVGSEAASLNDSHCQLELTTTRVKKMDFKEAGVNQKIVLASGSESVRETSVSRILLSLGRPGVLDVGEKSLNVECRRGQTGRYHLVFSFSEADKAKVKSEVSVAANEIINIAEISNDLNEKNKALGLSNVSFGETQGKDIMQYQLQVK